MSGRLRAAVREYIAADRALAELGIRDIAAGVLDETREFHAANRRVQDAERAMPWSVYFLADWLSGRRNRDVFQRLFAAQDRVAAERAKRSGS